MYAPFTFPHDQSTIGGKTLSAVFRQYAYNGQPNAGKIIVLFPFTDGIEKSVNICRAYFKSEWIDADYWKEIAVTHAVFAIDKEAKKIFKKLDKPINTVQAMTHEIACYEAGRRDETDEDELVDALRSALSACDIAKKRDPDQAGMYHCPHARETLAKYINPDDLPF